MATISLCMIVKNEEAVLPEFATCFKTKLPENMIYIIFPEALP